MSSAWDNNRASKIIDDHKTVPGGLIVTLHALQEEFGFVDDQAMPVLADAFNLSNADVFGVITFYHDFKRTRPGRHTIKVCRAEACQSMGSDDLVEDIKRRLDVDFGGTTADGAFTLEQAFCLGNCALCPSVMIDKKVYGRVTGARLESICQGMR